MIALGKALRRSAGLILAAAAAALCLGALLPSAAGARDLEVPTFLAPGRNPDLSPSSIPGGRPYEVINVFELNQTPVLEGIAGPAENLRNLRFDLPPGMVANAATFPSCSAEAFSARACPAISQVGLATPSPSAGALGATVGVFNVSPPPGSAAQFAFRAGPSAVHINFQIRNGTDYGATATVSGLSEVAGLVGSAVRIWGVPGDPLHDAERFAANGTPTPGPYPEPPPYRPLISNPTSCDGPALTSMQVSSWQRPDHLTFAAPFEAPPMSGCNSLDFSPTLSAKPTTNLADSPSGLDFGLHVPQNQDPEGSASAQLRTTRLTLPPGLAVNPSAAGGLGACSPAQIGLAAPANERQLLRYDLPPINFSGTFTVNFNGNATAPISATASAAQVRAGIEALPGLAGNVAVAGAKGGWIVSFTGALAGTRVPLLSGTVTDTAAQLIEVTATAGTYKLSFGGVETAPLPFNATEAEIEAALRAIPALGLGNLFPGNVFVGAAGQVESTRSYVVHLGGDLTGTNPPIGATSALSGPEAGVKITAQDPPGPRTLSVARIGGNAPGTPQFSPAPPACPDASKIGTVRVDSPAIFDHPLFGHVYLAAQGQNPFGSLLAIYLTVTDPTTGLVIKLPGKVETDASGRLVVTLAEAPQLPFEDLQVELFKGAAAPLKTAVGCGTFTVDTQLIPWSAPEAASARIKDSFRVGQGAGGGPCVGGEDSAPASSRFDAGTIEPSAGAYSPFTLRLARADGTRQLAAVDTTLPEGLLARLAGHSSCPEAALAAAAAKSGGAERAAPSCPATSRVGSLEISAGAGPAPYNLSGTAYLTGPYKGAPFSLTTITPALAGPFDLGTVLNRVALHLDPRSTRIHVVSDPFPQVLAGIGTDLRSVALILDAPAFTKNPTSCSPMAISGIQSAHFQVGDCGRLDFKPKLSLALSGDTKRGAHPGLRATLSFPGKSDEANLAALSVSLPKTLGFDKAHVKAICGAAQLSACPPASAVGTAKAQTPLLGEALAGKVYLRKGAGKLPGLAIGFSGPVDVALEGQLTASKAGVLSVSFPDIPDVALSKLTLTMAAGKKGLFKATANLCARPARASALIDGHNAKTADQRPLPAVGGCKKAGAKKAAKGKGAGR